MPSPTTPVTNNHTGQNGYSGTTQNQFMADGPSVASLTQSINKGGMRGLALLAVSIAEVALKKKATDLAKDYYNVNQQDYQFFQTVHQPAIGSTASEAFGSLNPNYPYDYYASVPAAIAKVNNVDKQWYEARRRIPKYNVGQQRRLDYDMGVARAHAVTAGWNAGIRYELNWADDHNNRAFNRKAAVVNVGIGMGNIVRDGLAASVSSLASSYDSLGDTVASFGNGYAAYNGYNDGRSQVRKATNGES